MRISWTESPSKQKPECFLLLSVMRCWLAAESVTAAEMSDSWLLRLCWWCDLRAAKSPKISNCPLQTKSACKDCVVKICDIILQVNTTQGIILKLKQITVNRTETCSQLQISNWLFVQTTDSGWFCFHFCWAEDVKWGQINPRLYNSDKYNAYTYFLLNHLSSCIWSEED